MSLSMKPTARATASGAWDRPFLDFRAQWRYLLGEWRLMFRPESVLSDALSGVAVALVALPLSLAIAAASGVEPGVGLVTAVIGGIVVALFGGCRLAVSGPAAAMTFLVYEIVTKYGVAGLMAATLLAGLFQVVAGAFRLGRFMEFIPRPVVAGFLTGIGLTILCTQLPVILGYEVSHDEEGGALALLWETLRGLRQTDPMTLLVGLTAGGVMLGLPRLSRKLPAPLLAVAAASALPMLMGWREVRLLGEIPSGFPWPGLPSVPWGLWNELVMASLTIFILASLESLLSASVVDSMSEGTRSDHDQELIGQGMGNLASALFGGIPVTGVIARSATNVQSGGKTRLASLLHALILLAMLFGLSTVVARIPRAALAGVLVAVAFRMIEIRMFRSLWRSSRVEAVILLATAGAIVLTDLIVGVPVGMIGAFLYVVHELSRLNLRSVSLGDNDADAAEFEAADRCPAVLLLRIEGPLFFASGFHLRSMVKGLTGSRCVVLDLEQVPFLDVSGAETLESAIQVLRDRGNEVILTRLAEAVLKRVEGLDHRDFPALRGCPIYGELRDAMLHATTEVTGDDLCRTCRPSGRCQGLEKALKGVEVLDRTPVPRVRAVIARTGNGEASGHEPQRSPHGEATPLAALTRETLRPSPLTTWNRRNMRPVIDPTAYIDPYAAVIGEVAIGARVYVGPGVSVRADEGTPFFIGDDANLQDGVTMHALKGKVVLVQGRPYAIYIGKHVCLTHHALIHGPCFIGDRCFIGFKSTVHDAIVGEGCVLGLGAVVVGVTLPPGRYVGHGVVVDTQEKAEALPIVAPDWERLRDEVVEVNQELALGHRQGTTPDPDANAAMIGHEGPV